MKEEVVAPMILPVMGHHQQPQQQQHNPHYHHHHHHHHNQVQPLPGSGLKDPGMDHSSVAHCQDPEGSGPLYMDSTPGVQQQHSNAQQQQQQYASIQQLKELEDECLSLRENQAKMKQQLIESQRRERLMMRRLAAKEQELLDYVNQVAELKSVQTPGQTALKAAVLDPAVNVLFQKLKQELQTTQARLEETQNELAAWKFTPDSNTGKRLMAKCRLLHQENEELGKLTSNGRLAKLESELAMQKGISEDLKKSHCDLDEVLLELEEDVEGMQNTILLMQRELKVEKERNQSIERDNVRMLSVLRDKPEWLSVVQAAAAAEERLKQEQQQHIEHRLNGDVADLKGGVVKSEEDVPMEVEMRTQQSVGAVTVSLVDEEEVGVNARGEEKEKEGEESRTAESASEVVDDQPQPATNGKPAAVVVQDSVSNNSSSSNNNNNGQSMTTRKRTRSSVALSGAGASGEEPVDAQEAPEESGGLKRNRYSAIVNSDKSGAPRTRGQLQQEAEKKLESVAEGGEENGGGAGDAVPVNKGGVTAAAGAVLFSNNNNNNGNKLLLSNCGSTEGAAVTPEENGRTTESLKLNGGGVGGGIELNNV